MKKMDEESSLKMKTFFSFSRSQFTLRDTFPTKKKDSSEKHNVDKK